MRVFTDGRVTDRNRLAWVTDRDDILPAPKRWVVTCAPKHAEPCGWSRVVDSERAGAEGTQAARERSERMAEAHRAACCRQTARHERTT
jgi:hypothetical protein